MGLTRKVQHAHDGTTAQDVIFVCHRHRAVRDVVSSCACHGVGPRTLRRYITWLPSQRQFTCYILTITNMDSYNNNNNNSQKTTGRSAHDKVKGAAEVVHGLGETVRGNLLSTVEPQGNEQVARRGEQEMRQGNADMARGPKTGEAGIPGAGNMNTAHGETHPSRVGETTGMRGEPDVIPGTSSSTQHAQQHRPGGLPEEGRPGDYGFVPGARGGGF